MDRPLGPVHGREAGHSGVSLHLVSKCTTFAPSNLWWSFIFDANILQEGASYTLTITVYIWCTAWQYVLVSCDLCNLSRHYGFLTGCWTQDMFNVVRVFSVHSDYFEDYGQNQISSIQFSPNGLYLAIVTDDRSVVHRRHLMICLNMSWWTCLWAERFQTDVMCFVELFGSGSQERKGWWCRPKRTETLMDSAASTIHKGEWSPQGKSPKCFKWLVVLEML